MSTIGSSSGITSRRTGLIALPSRDGIPQRQQRAAYTYTYISARPSRGALQVHASKQNQQQPLLMKAMAGISAGVLMFQAGTSFQPDTATAATASLTEIQLQEAEKLYELMRERTGKDLPRLNSSPNAPQVQGAPKFVQAGQDAMISQLKSQLERMNQLLAAEKQLVEADRQELNRLQQAIARMRAAEAAAPALTAPPVQVPLPAPIQVQAAPAAASGDSNLLSSVAIGGLGLFAVTQNIKNKSTKEDLDNLLATERKRVASLEAQAAKMRAELAKEQELVAQLRQQMELSEQRSRLTITSEKRQRDLASRANEQAKKSLEEERKRILAAKFEVIAAREKAQAALAAKEQEMLRKMEQAIEREQQRSRLMVTSAKREKMLEEQISKTAKQQLEAERKRVLATKNEVFAVRERALAALLAKEQEMAAKMEQAVEKEQQMGRLMLTSAKRESMLAMRTNDEVKKQAETDRKRMLATKMEIIDVRERAHASLLAKEAEMTVKMDQAVEKEKQLGRLWLTSAKRESMLAMRTNEEVKKMAETDRKRMLATKMEIITVREKAHASLLAKEEEMIIKMDQAVEKEKQLGRLWLTSARRKNMMAMRTNDEVKKAAETDRKRMLATKMEIIDVRERAHASLLAKEEEMNIKLNKAVEKEQQLGRLWLTSAKRENMMAMRTNDEVKKQADTDRKRMLATKMEIIAVREKAHANLLAKEAEMNIKLDKAVEKEQQLGRLWLTSARRENMMAARTNEEVRKMAETDRKRMLATKMEIIDVREKAHATVVAKQEEMTIKMNQAIEKEQQMGRLWLTSAKRENMMAKRTNEEVKKTAEHDRKRMLATKMEIIDVRERAHATLIAKEEEMTIKMEQAVDKEKQLGRLWLTSSKRENMLAVRSLEDAKKALDTDRKRMVAAKREAIAAREEAAADRTAREKAATARLAAAIEREQQISRLQQASARREAMLLARDADAVKKAAEADRKRLIAAKSDVLATMSKAQADRLAIETEMMAKMKAEVERVQQFGRLSVASERRQVVEARRAVAEATKTVEAERKMRIAARSEALTYREQVVAERNEKVTAVAEVERLQQLVQRSGGNGGAIVPKAVTAQDNKPNAKVSGATASLHKELAQMVGSDTVSIKSNKSDDKKAAISAAEKQVRNVQMELESAEKEAQRVQQALESAQGQVQAATAQIDAMQQQQEQREQLPQQLQVQVDAAAKKEKQLLAQVESLKVMMVEAAEDSEEEADAAQLQATIEFAERKAANAAASTSALRAELAEAAKSLASASTDIKNAESARTAAQRNVEQLSQAVQQALQRVAELKSAAKAGVSEVKPSAVAAKPTTEATSGYRSDEEEARNEVAELAEKAKQITLSHAVASDSE